MIYSALRDFVFSPTAARLAGEPLFFLMGRRKGKPLELNGIRRVLVIKLDELGDAVMATPFMRELRAGLPNASITLVVKPQLKELWELCPYIDELLTYDRLSGPANIHGHSSVIQFSKDSLWKKRFDLAIVPRWDADPYYASFMAYFSGARFRLGYRNKESRNLKCDFNYNALYTHLLASGDASRHEVEKNLMLLSFLNLKIAKDGLELWLDSKDVAFADNILKDVDRPKIVYGIGAASEKRVWPIDNFLELTKRLKAGAELSIIVLGGEKERTAGDILEREFRDCVINLAGKTSIRQAAAVLKKSDVYVGNDSGLMHVAAGVGTPVVEISCHPLNGSEGHYNAPSRFGPWGVQKIILQPERTYTPCIDACNAEQAHCINAVGISAVQNAVLELIKNKKTIYPLV